MKSGSPASKVQYFTSCLHVMPTQSIQLMKQVSTLKNVHTVIAQKISEIVSDGIVKIHEVKRSLRNYVYAYFSKRHRCQPSPSDHAFHPSLQDI